MEPPNPLTSAWLLSPAAREWLVAQKAIADAATPGPWFFARINGNELESLVYEDGEEGDSELIPALTTDANWSLCEAAANNYAALLTALLEAGEEREWRVRFQSAGIVCAEYAESSTDAHTIAAKLWQRGRYSHIEIESRRPAGEWKREEEKLP